TAILERSVNALNQELQAGAVSKPEVTLMQIALTKNQLDLADARRLSADARVRVADAIGVSVKALDDFNLAFGLSGRHPAASELMATGARELALRGRADILGALADYAASQSALQLEIAKQYPDIHLGPGYQFNNGDSQFTVALTVELPVLSQNQGPIAEAEARRFQSAARFKELQAKVITEIDRAVAAYQVTQKNLSTLESLEAEQKSENESVEAQVKVGAADQLALLNSQIEVGASELVRLDGQMKAEQAFGALEDALQRPIDAPKPPIIERQQRAKKENQP
ncbi:MAG TPA: TolC family protein, partial [Verrucomicrobiae bacterium]|nr:TolC family protein [Verrucomicrobiae bacterium]